MPDQPQAPSLIQRRMTLSRGLAYPIAAIAVSALNLMLQIVPLVESGGTAGWRWIGVVLWAVLLTASIVMLVRARGAIVAFEREHGRDAGRQKPVGHPGRRFSPGLGIRRSSTPERCISLSTYDLR